MLNSIGFFNLIELAFYVFLEEDIISVPRPEC
ncbi:MAG: hypothetical protein BWX51_00568 [Bacteroidetes bacterium ADurb.Bin012]|jgi:hypothetical protein|nr:MAG: hypothetical protein BWX51_00568 [Bacteroidetes bacterium ADurb.Bin012]